MGLLGPITMKVIGDTEVDPEFGTGIMKVTPAHDFHDYELGKKYGLPVTPIIDFKGKMDFSWYLSKKDIPEQYKKRAEEYHGLHVSKARPLMIQHLKDDNLLERIDESYEHTVSVCYRCKTLLEPLPLAQFFIKVAPLVKPVITALDKGKIHVHGAGYDKILRNWLTILKDWNISRQIVWGIRQPVWYGLKENPTIEVTFLDEQKKIQEGKIGDLLLQFPLEVIKKGLQTLRAPMGATYTIAASSPGEDYIQETDTFDTWFSSGQWPVVTLKTTNTADFDSFYPTNVMETAYDILMMWVMRMLMFGYYLTGKPPFTDVYLHGLVRDEKGFKMSKSKGNVINPLDIVEKYGADALRMALVMSTTAGQDSSTGENKIRGMRNLTNKLWNAGRFIIEFAQTQSTITPDNGPKDKIFYKKLEQVVDDVTKQLNDLRVGLAAETVYNEFWHWFCDESIEECKKGEISRSAITKGFITFLTLFHPFVPFITESLYQQIPGWDGTLLIASSWPLRSK
jgi:valyl-tRNA synthetase